MSTLIGRDDPRITITNRRSNSALGNKRFWVQASTEGTSVYSKVSLDQSVSPDPIALLPTLALSPVRTVNAPRLTAASIGSADQLQAKNTISTFSSIMFGISLILILAQVRNFRE